MTKTAEGWMISTKTIVSILASMVVILGGIGGTVGWAAGIYNSVDRRMNGMERRIAIAETLSVRMSEDIKDIKSMTNQMVMNRVDNRPEVQKWSK